MKMHFYCIFFVKDLERLSCNSDKTVWSMPWIYGSVWFSWRPDNVWTGHKQLLPVRACYILVVKWHLFCICTTRNSSLKDNGFGSFIYDRSEPYMYLSFILALQHWHATRMIYFLLHYFSITWYFVFTWWYFHI